MSYVVVEDFRAGLDSRRDIISGPPGSLNDLINAHITRGGDIEKRKAFVPTFLLPPGTYHAEAAKDQIFVFGSDAAPGGIPAGVTYQRLQHPDGLAMTRIVMTKVFEGKIFALAEFTGGIVLPFFDGALAAEWVNGIVRGTMVNTAGIAAHLASIIDAHPDFIATSLGAEITITGAKNKAFTVDVTATNKEGGVDNQTITKTDIETAVEDVAEVKATSTFRILGGSAAAGVNRITSVTVNGVEQLNAAVNFAGSNELTAQDVAASINAKVANPNFTATAAGDVVTMTAPAGTGATLNGANVIVTTAGNVITCIGSFTITDGTTNPAVNTVVSVKVNGVTITGAAAVNFTTDNSTTAALVAASINTLVSNPNYQAFANGPTVLLSDTTAEPDDPKNFTVAVTTAGNVTATASSVSSTVTAPAGGRLATTGQPQITKVTLGGTFEVGDKYRIKLGAVIFGFDRVGEETPVAVLPLKDKIYIAAGSIMFFSGVGKPVNFNSDAIGAGLINMSNEGGGFEDLVALGIFRNNIAALTRDTVQVWFVDADPLRNAQLQVLPNIGTIAANSVVTFGDNDIFFLSDTGIRSLRVRDTTENLSVYDVGTPIDDRVLLEIAPLSEAQRSLAVGAIEPNDGRFWMVIGPNVFVFTYFSASKISAWSIYQPGFEITALTKLKGRLYARAGDVIHTYGGLPGNVFDSCRVRAVLPYLDANTPATHKTFSGMDVVLSGEWRVKAGTDPTIPDAREEIMVVNQPTLNLRAIPFTGYGTHVGLEFVNEAPGPAKLSKAIVHFTVAEDD